MFLADSGLECKSECNSNPERTPSPAGHSERPHSGPSLHVPEGHRSAATLTPSYPSLKHRNVDRAYLHAHFLVPFSERLTCVAL